MIDLATEALRRMIRTLALGGDGNGVETSFEAPTRDWAARRSAPTVNVFLYDVREDRSVRREGRIPVTGGADGIVTGRLRPPRYFRLSYLVTAWTQRSEDEHRLLAAVLAGALQEDYIPDEFVPEELAAIGLPLRLAVGQAHAEERAIAEVWQGLGGDLKPSIDLTVGMPIQPGRPQVAGPPVRDGLTVLAGVREGFGPSAGGRPGSPGPVPDAAAQVGEEAGAAGDAGADPAGGRERLTSADSPRSLVMRRTRIIPSASGGRADGGKASGGKAGGGKADGGKAGGGRAKRRP